jgi:hypothetical protein
MSTSTTFDLAGIVKALVAATEWVHGNLRGWQPVPQPDKTDRQLELLRRLEAISVDLARIPELKAWAAMSADELNAILKREGFEIQLTRWPIDGRNFGVVAILDVTVEWIEAGDGTKQIRHRTAGGQHDHATPAYPAFELSAYQNRLELLAVSGSDQPLIRIPTKSGDVVCIHVTPDAGLDTFGLYDAVTRISAAAKPDPDTYGEVLDVTIPKVKLRQQVDISWMEGMHIGRTTPQGDPDHFDLQEAKQEVRFVMNERGARAKTATAMAARSLSVGNPLLHVRIDNDFLLWIERPGVATPVFVGYFAKDDSWSDPGSLDNV